jgi:hypothetical protein
MVTKTRCCIDTLLLYRCCISIHCICCIAGALECLPSEDRATYQGGRDAAGRGAGQLGRRWLNAVRADARVVVRGVCDDEDVPIDGSRREISDDDEFAVVWYVCVTRVFVAAHITVARQPPSVVRRWVGWSTKTSDKHSMPAKWQPLCQGYHDKIINN